MNEKLELKSIGKILDKECFLNKIEKFQDEQEAQKKRGLNNYNVMGAIRKLNAEVGMHSNFIYSLLDINGEHYQGALFVNLFVKHVLKIDDFGEVVTVEMEELTFDNRRIDFTIKSNNYFIGVEMKIYASDEKNQISDYRLDLEKKVKSKKNPYKDAKVKIYYLTLDGKAADSKSLKSIEGMIEKDYTKIAFKDEILTWLKESKKQVSNITNLNNAIGYYIDVINMLIGKYESPIQEFKDFFSSKEMYEAFKEYGDELEKYIVNVLELMSGFSKAKQKLHDNYFKRLLEPLIRNNNSIVFYKYDIENEKVILNYNKYFEIWILASQNKFKSLGIRPSWGTVKWQGNKPLTTILETKNNALQNCDNIKAYIIGKTKGVHLSGENTFPEINIDSLFKDEEVNINLNEIEKHINIIKDSIRSI